ncbi:hypothetical protein LP414_15825 [Polaromonas sp. P1(28)-13]|nr:hypothetical protein LP417_25935 [Polaromonas sp. P1-6]UUZ75016.1 hypothetical protein LP414_23440 [Polaromonas sp. P1(28)-13]UUZ78154.1 hypothetical protein LP414_15825 [Polaromonas sp. P1(28)-13]
MSAIKRRGLSKQEWSEVMRRFEGAGATVKRFCAQEGLSTQSFYRWRDRLGGDGGVRAPTPPTSALIRQPRSEADSFIELGELPGAAPPRTRARGLSCAWSLAGASCCKS